MTPIKHQISLVRRAYLAWTKGVDVIGAKKASFLHNRLSSTAHIPDSLLSLMRNGLRQTLPDQKDIQAKPLLRKSHKAMYTFRSPFYGHFLLKARTGDSRGELNFGDHFCDFVTFAQWGVGEYQSSPKKRLPDTISIERTDCIALITLFFVKLLSITLSMYLHLEFLTFCMSILITLINVILISLRELSEIMIMDGSSKMGKW